MLVSARDLVLRLPRADERLHPRRIERQSVPVHRLCRHRAGGPVRDRSAACPRYRADAGRRPKDPRARRLRSKRAAERTAPTRSGPAANEASPEAVSSVAFDSGFRPGHRPGAAIQRRASARAGICDVRRHRSRRGLSSRRVVDGAAEAGARRRCDPGQDRSDRCDVPGSRTGRAKPRRYVRPHRRHRQRPAQPVFDAGRNPLPAGADRAGDARRTFHRIHADGDAGAGREAGAGARSRGAIDRGVCRQSRPPAVGYVLRQMPLRPS